MRAKTAGDIGRAALVNERRRQGLRRTAAKWTQIIEAQRQSDLTVVEFCRRRRIAKATFWYWRKRLVTTEKQERVAKPAQNFFAVPLVAAVAERIEADLGTMRVRLDGAEAVRVTNGFSKKVENHAHALAIYSMHYNFGRVHKTLRVTPAMQAGISDHVWSLEQIATLAN